MKCLICNREFNTKDGLSVHIKRKHKVSQEEYYNMFNPNIVHKCLNCGKDTNFINIYSGYSQYCSQYCVRHSEKVKEKREQTCQDKYGSSNVYSSEYGKEKIKNTLIKKYNIDHPAYSKEFMKKAKNTQLTNINKFCDLGYTTVSSLIDLYGTGWYQAGIVDIIKYDGYTFVSNSQIDIIVNYYFNRGSKHHIELLKFIQSIYLDIIKVNDKIEISPYELDIYLPKLKLAIEYNGIYWHSIENNISKDYHLNKSLLCREKNIRLIHIYEFEDLDKQKQLLKDLILGQDNYPKEDFNKNNLIDSIPKPEIICIKPYIIYGAGKLL